MAGIAGIGAIGKVIGLIGTVVSAAGTIAAGKSQQAAANFEAAQLEIKAQEERAASQRDALEQKRETNFLQSRGQAVASASGLGTLDPTVQELSGDLEQAGAYREGMIRYGGEERARGLRAQAEGARMSGKAARQGATLSAIGTLAGGLAQTFSGKYGGSGPDAEDRTDLMRPSGNSFFAYG